MIGAIRFGKKVRVESTFQIKHRFLLWWLKNQAAKEAAAMVAERVEEDASRAQEDGRPGMGAMGM